MAQGYISPFRYRGGKSWFVDTFLRWWKERNVRLLVEPFAGGASGSLSCLEVGACERVVFPVVALGLLKAFRDSGKCVFHDSEIKRIYQGTVAALKAHLTRISKTCEKTDRPDAGQFRKFFDSEWRTTNLEQGVAPQLGTA
jgi:hypothetical protein